MYEFLFKFGDYTRLIETLQLSLGYIRLAIDVGIYLSVKPSHHETLALPY